MKIPLNDLNKKLLFSFLTDKHTPLGLANGKMGFCLFTFWLARLEKNEEYQKIAENLLKNIFNEVDTVRNTDVMDGLAGIGLAIRFLIKESYVQGNANAILRDLDDVIFKRLSYSKNLEAINHQSVIQTLFYLYIQAKCQKKESESEYLCVELIIAMINHTYQRADLSFFEEPPFFSSNYMLPQLLFVFSKICSLNLYNFRIFKVLEEMSPKIFSILPILNVNRLYLMWGMNSVLEQVNIKGWNNHMLFLKKNTDMNCVLNDELRNRNIYINNGLAGVYLLLSSLGGCFSENEMKHWKIKIIKKVESSDIWNLVQQEPEFLLQNRGLLSGFCGVFMMLSDAKSKHVQL